MIKTDFIRALTNPDYPIVNFMLSKENYYAESLEILQYIANDDKTLYVNLEKSFDDIVSETARLKMDLDGKFIIGDKLSVRKNPRLKDNCIIIPKEDSLVGLSLKIPEVITRERIKYCLFDHTEDLLDGNQPSELDGYILYLVHNLRTYNVKIIFLVKKNSKGVIVKKLLDNYAITFDLL